MCRHTHIDIPVELVWSHLLGDGGLWLSAARCPLLAEDGFSGLNDLEGGRRREGERKREEREREGGREGEREGVREGGTKVS